MTLRAAASCFQRARLLRFSPLRGVRMRQSGRKRHNMRRRRPSRAKAAPVCRQSASFQCYCRQGVEGRRCERCKSGLFNYPSCEVSERLTCNPPQAHSRFDRFRSVIATPRVSSPALAAVTKRRPASFARAKVGRLAAELFEVVDWPPAAENVEGRTCSQCQPTFWDLRNEHIDGCIGECEPIC